KQVGVSSKHAGNRAACAHQRHARGRVDDNLRPNGGEAAAEIEQNVQQLAQTVFDVVAEDPQIKHVTEKMQPAAMKEHAAYHVEQRIERERRSEEHTSELQ